MLMESDKKGKEVGFTYQPFTHETPATGFMSSEYGSRGETMNISQVTDAKINEYANKNRDLLADPKNYVGGWLSGGTFYMDVSKRFGGKTRGSRSSKSRR